MNTETTDAPRLGYAKGGKIRHMAGGGLIDKLFGKSGPEETPSQKWDREAAKRMEKAAKNAPAPAAAAPAAPAPATALDPANALKKREAAAGLAKGGPVPGESPSDIADNIPIMATAGEFMVRKPAVDKIEAMAPGLLDTLNAMGDDKPKLGRVKRKRTRGKRKMAVGGPVLPDEDVKFQRPPRAPQLLQGQVNQLNQNVVDFARANANPTPDAFKGPGGVPGISPGAAAPSNAIKFAIPPDPINATTSAGARPMPAPMPNGPSVNLDARPGATVNPNVARGVLSAEGAAFQAQQASRAAPPVAAPAAAPTAAAAPAAGPSRLGVIRGTVNRIGKSVAPLALGATAAQVATTDTEDYAKRFGLENTQPGVLRDVGIRTLGAASDLGNTMALGIPRALGAFRDDAAATPPVAGQLAPNQTITPPRAAAAAPAPMPVAAAQEMAAPALGQVTRVGNSYSGAPGISGDITVNGKTPRGGFMSAGGGATPASPGGGSDQALFEARKAAILRGDTASVQASYGGNFGPRTDPIDALINNGRPMTARKAAAIAQLQAAKAQADGSATDRRLAADRFALDKEGADLTNREKKGLLSAQDAYANAKTPAEKAAAEGRLRALQGKYEKEQPDEYAGIAGGTDENGAKRDPLIYSKRTGEVKGAGPALPPGMVKQVGTSGGKPVYEDKSGKRFIGG